VATLRAAPYYLGDTMSVFARVTATNAIGDSAVSSEGNGAILPVSNAVPAPPSVFTTDAQSTTSITFSWSEPYNGGSSITGY